MSHDRGWTHRLAGLLMAHAAWRLRETRPDWGAAMRAEMHALDNGFDKLKWSAGCAAAAYRQPATVRAALYVLGLLTAAACVGVFEWRTDEDMVTLAVLAAASFAIGVLRPTLFWLTGATLGSIIAALNMFTSVTGLRPIYESASQAASHSLGYGLSLAVLVLPATVAAAVGGLAGTALRKLRAGSQR